jgi:hypothetical protein
VKIRQREPVECPHRCESNLEEVSCLIADLVDLPATSCEVAEDACNVCCQFPVPATDTLNPVIGSLVSGLTERLLESGHPRLDPQQLLDIQSRARGNLRGSAQDDPAGHFETRDLTPCCHLGEPRGDIEYDCRHPDHDVTTTDQCRWCRGWSETPDQPPLRDLVEVIPPPAERHASQLRNWAVGVTTAPRDQSTLGLSVDSLIRAGWTNPVIFADGKVDVPRRFDHLRTTRRVNQLGAWPNFLLGLQELLFAEPDADAYLMVQDDAVFCDGVDVREYLEDHVLWPGASPSIVSLYCPAPYTKEPDTWHTLDEAWVWGALAFVFLAEIAKRMILDKAVHEHRWQKERNGKALIDVMIGEWAARNESPIHYPVPSLVQHIGHVSTVFAGNHVLGPRREVCG